VTPISLGIFASANQSAGTTSYESIAVSTVGSGGASSVSFTSIPGTYSHLQIRYLGRDNRASDSDDLMFRLQQVTITLIVYMVVELAQVPIELLGMQEH
jgi:hypothetical protein